jgi:glycosyltransferase involved in cell wall biosynthesis
VRILIVSWTSRKAGGVESYVERVGRSLRAAGHATGLLFEVDKPVNREPIRISDETPLWCVSAIGLKGAIDAVRAWKPDVIYGHGLADPAVEAATLEIAPAVLFAHGYRGVCISGSKRFNFPATKPCSRHFGWQCLLHFYPHRCGGLNPFTMWQDFRRESGRLRMLRSYRTIITASAHMRSEFLKHGFAPECVTVIPLPADSIFPLDRKTAEGVERGRPRSLHVPFRLLFVGRMEVLKGGDMLLDALPLLLPWTERRVDITFVGDGPERDGWERRGARIQVSQPRLQVKFTGWLSNTELESLFRESDLLVMPSLWPEPFGLTGPEAGLHSLPAAAFAVGGIPEWLRDGVNGSLAPADPPSASGLALAIRKCLADPYQYQQLRSGALRVAQTFSIRNHMYRLIEILDSATRFRWQLDPSGCTRTTRGLDEADIPRC